MAPKRDVDDVSMSNPQPEPSHLPDSILDCRVQLNTKNVLAQDELGSIQCFRRAADYIAAAMIFLKDHTLLKRELSHDDIKPRLLVLIYAHLNRILFPGHGAPAILACLWLENSLSVYYPEYSRDKDGLHSLISRFSVPGGLPSHVNSEVPGCIHEGGELGYAISVSFGAIMDRPDPIVACVVGDGEAETGPTATAWHSFKYIDSAESGTVLPIVHVNGFKISGSTIYGMMDDKEIVALFSGYGYQVRLVDDLGNIDIDQDLSASIEWALDEIHKIQTTARTGNPVTKPRRRCLFFGWGAPKSFHGQVIEGSFHAHQVPPPGTKKDPEQFALLSSWLSSYKPYELFDEDDFLADAIAMNKSTFRMFSPDELYSNKLDGALRETTRNFQWDPASRARGGRVIEILSEHTCQGMLQGYTLTGRTGLFPSNEAFLGIIHTMMVQYAKFIKMGRGHNGFSHQNPSFIGAVLNLKSEVGRVFLPPEANCFLSTMVHCLRSRDYVNLMPQPTPVWLSVEEADTPCIAGRSVWKFASVDGGDNPNVVIVRIGTEVTFEVIAAAALLRKYAPALPCVTHPHALSDDGFETLFTSDRAVHRNFHGYPIELKGLLFGRPRLERVTIEGYREEGTTTSPLDQQCVHNARTRADATELEAQFMHMAQKDHEYIHQYGEDPAGTSDTPKFG
ncbi:XFP N-terminal domain-containing protein [Russula dissimulans]|nr:XFP N-terminal domain-containing protein [Russula dissimulans]